jgi:hypothetical protein
MSLHTLQDSSCKLILGLSSTSWRIVKRTKCHDDLAYGRSLRFLRTTSSQCYGTTTTNAVGDNDGHLNVCVKDAVMLPVSLTTEVNFVSRVHLCDCHCCYQMSNVLELVNHARLIYSSQCCITKAEGGSNLPPMRTKSRRSQGSDDPTYAL